MMGILLFSVSVWAIRRELNHYDIDDIWQSFSRISDGYVVWAIALTGLNYCMLTGYDTLAARYVQLPLPYRKTALVATLSYAISNTVGAALLSGSAIRYRFYTTWGISAPQIAQIIAFCNLSFWLGLLTLGGVLFVVEPIDIPAGLSLPFGSLKSVGVLFLVIVGTYLLFSAAFRRSLRIGSWTLPRLTWQMAIAQIGITSCDWALAAGALYVLLYSPALPSYPGFLGIYVFAQVAGILSSVPGGLGVFETVMLLLLSPPLASTTLLGTLLAFRAIYYFGPLLLAMVVLGIYEVSQLKRQRSR